MVHGAPVCSVLVGVYTNFYIDCIEFLHLFSFQSHHGDTLLNFATVTQPVSIFQACVYIVIVLGVNIQLCAWILIVISSVGVANWIFSYTVVASIRWLLHSQICQTDTFERNSATFIALIIAFCGCFLPVTPSRPPRRRSTLLFRSREFRGIWV